MLKPLLGHEAWQTRASAAWAIGQFVGGARLALRELRTASRDKHAAVRRTAFGALMRIFPKDRDLYDAYQKAYAEEQEWRTLSAYGGDPERALEALVSKLDTGNELTRTVAAHRLGDLGPRARKAVHALVAALDDPQRDVRIACLRALQDIGIRDPTPILRSLQDRDPQVREDAAQLLGTVAELLGERSLAALTALLRDPADDVRADVVDALLAAGAKGIAALTAAFAQGPEMRLAAVEALRTAGPKAAPATAALGRLLDDPVAEVWDAAIAALAEIGEPAIPTLVGGLSNRRPEVRRMVADVLGELDPKAKAAIPALRKLVDDPVADVRRAAISALLGIDPATVPVLVDWLAHKDIEIRFAAAEALMEVDPTARAAIPALRKLIEDPVAKVRHAAASALLEIDPAAISVFIGWLAHKDSEVRLTAADALSEAGPINPAAIPVFVEWLAHEDIHIRLRAVDELMEAGPKARAAVPALRKLLADSSEDMRAAAELALEAIERS